MEPIDMIAWHEIIRQGRVDDGHRLGLVIDDLTGRRGPEG